MNASSFLTMESYAQVLQAFAAFAAAAQAKTSVKGVLKAFDPPLGPASPAVTVLDTLPQVYEAHAGNLVLFTTPTGRLPKKRVARKVVWKSPRGLQALRNGHEGIFSSYRRRSDAKYSYRIYRTALAGRITDGPAAASAPSAWLMHVVAASPTPAAPRTAPPRTRAASAPKKAAPPAPAPAPASLALALAPAPEGTLPRTGSRKSRLRVVVPRKFAPPRRTASAAAPAPAPASASASASASAFAAPTPMMLPSPTAARILDYTCDDLLLSPAYAGIVQWHGGSKDSFPWPAPAAKAPHARAFPALEPRSSLASLASAPAPAPAPAPSAASLGLDLKDEAWLMETMRAAAGSLPLAPVMPLPSPIGTLPPGW